MSNRQQTQDYIARIRYSNALPPPPFAPKLLNIQNATLESGQYTSIGFASRLYREQPLNIETDAELGMRIDLIGLPGIFDEDQTAITFPDKPPPLDPRDRALLKPLSSLGKGASATSGVSFLRRTEYITSHTKGKDDHGALRSKLPANRRPPPPKAQAPKTDREGMVRQIEKSFNIAYPKDSYTGPDTPTRLQGAEITKSDRDGWFNPKHPTNPSLKVLDSYPIVPDLHALPDSGTYLLIKFSANPSSVSNAYDPKLDHLILQPREPADEEKAAYQAELEEYKANRLSTKPVLPEEYVAYIPSGETSEIVPALKRKFDLFDKNRDDDDLYTIQDAGHQAAGAHFAFDRLRAYETATKYGSAETMWNETVALSLHDGPSTTKKGRGSDGPVRQKAAYIYPIMSRSGLRQKRQKIDRMGRRQEEDDERKGADVLEVVVGEFEEGARDEVIEKIKEYDPQAIVV